MTREELAALRDALDGALALPESVLNLLALILAPVTSSTRPDLGALKSAQKPNGHDRHRPQAAAQAAPPSALATRPERASLQRKPVLPAAERKLITALTDNPGLSAARLAKAAGMSRSGAGDRLRRLARAGVIEKDDDGRWRIKETEPGPPQPPAA